MNELKKELIKVAGDLSVSEANVKETLNRQPQKRPYRFLPAIISLAIVCLAATLLFIQTQPNRQATILSHEEYSYHLYRETQLFNDELTEATKTRALDKLLSVSGLIEYGKSLGFSVSTQEIDERIQRNEEVVAESKEYEAMIQTLLNEANISAAYYENELLPKLTEAALYQQKIQDELMKTYTHLNDMTAQLMASEQGKSYVEEQFAEEIQAFRQQYQINEASPQWTSIMGVVALVEGNMFYLLADVLFPDVAHLTHKEIYALSDATSNSAWYPNVDALDVAVGDIVKVRTGSWSRTEDDGFSVGYNYGEAEILQRAAHPQAKINLTGVEAQVFDERMQQVKWQYNTHVPMLRLPDYIVSAKGITYSIWAKYNNSGMEIVQHEPNAYVSLTKGPATPIFDLLQ